MQVIIQPVNNDGSTVDVHEIENGNVTMHTGIGAPDAGLTYVDAAPGNVIIVCSATDAANIHAQADQIASLQAQVATLKVGTPASPASPPAPATQAGGAS
jgi:hypothetical protein